MKKWSLILCMMLMTHLLIAQTVTINVAGNNNRKIVVDGRAYTINNTNSSSEQDVVINDLSTGQHTLQVVRTNPNNNRATTTSTQFTVREDYDLDIRVTGNGAVSMIEKRKGRPNIGNPVSSAAFNKLLNAAKSRTTSSSRSAYLEEEFSRPNKWYTSSQLSQLIKLVNTESLRLKLAKQAYTKSADPQNFSLVSNLLSSAANRQSLRDYIANLPEGETGSGLAGVPMTDQRFTQLYQEVAGMYNATDKNYYLVNFFNKDYNFYTSTQARQLIQLVPAETERLNLGKLAYRGVTDPENFSEVIQLLSSFNARTELSRYVDLYGEGIPTQAMSAADFNTLYQKLYRQSSTNRYAAIHTAFTTPGNYFTSAQARQLIRLVSNESNRLLLSKTAYKVLTDRSNYTVFNSLLSSQANRNDLEDYVDSFDSYSAGSGVNLPMSDASFNQLYRNVADTWSTTSKYNLIHSAFQSSSNYFTTTQIRQLLVLFNSESDRLSLAKTAFDNLTDPYNYNAMSDLFTSSANKNEWARYAMQYSGGTVPKVAMTDSEFNSMYREVQFTFGFGAKMSRLTNIFNTETNYFTTAQARELIALVSAESNRLELSKLAYNNLTDPSNYLQLSEILSSQSSKDQLKYYVENNAYLNQ